MLKTIYVTKLETIKSFYLFIVLIGFIEFFYTFSRNSYLLLGKNCYVIHVLSSFIF